MKERERNRHFGTIRYKYREKGNKPEKENIIKERKAERCIMRERENDRQNNEKQKEKHKRVTDLDTQQKTEKRERKRCRLSESEKDNFFKCCGGCDL